MVANKDQPPFSHRFHLPSYLSKSGIKPSRKARINFIIIALILVFCFVDLVLNVITMGRMYPGVSIAAKDMSFQTRKQVIDILHQQQPKHTLTVTVGDKSFRTSTSDLGTQYDVNTTVNTAYEAGRATAPLLSLLRLGSNGQVGYAYSIDQTKLKSFVQSVLYSAGYSATNAKVVIQDGVVSIEQDKSGLRIDEKQLNRLLSNALANGKDAYVVLEPKQVEAELKVADTLQAKEQAEKLLERQVTIHYNNKDYTADKVALGHMIGFREVTMADGKMKLEVYIAQEQVAGWVQSVANQIDIKPVNKKIEVRNGTSTVTQEGKDGLAISQQPLIDAIVSGLSKDTNVNVDATASPVAYKTEYNRTVGLDYNQYIEVNLSQQRLWAWQDNKVVFTTPVTSGASAYGFGTPTGLFSIYGKERSRYLNGAQYGWGYNVYVDYWMPFNGGVGFHDADWRSSFGGQDYIGGGSHGCVNMSKSSAAFLYGWASIGTPVWVHY